MSEVIFEITDDLLESGLRGFPVGYCTSSDVDPLKGLSYSGTPIAELADKDPYEVIYLLYYGKTPSSEELKKFSDDLKKRAKCRPEVAEHIRKLPREGHPMKLFCSALLILGMLEGKGDYREDCLNLIAKIPEVAATVINYHAGWGQGKPSNPDLGYMENFTQMLNVPGGHRDGLTETFKLFNVLHYDHGGGNLSTFVGKAVASGLEDMYGSITAAMCALAGPRHGKANQDCLEFVQKVLGEVGENASAADVAKLIRNKLASNELLFGFGHAVLRVEDARASVLYKIAQNKFPNHPLVKITKLLRSEGPKILAENPKISDPYPNVDAISGTVLSAAGFEYPQYFTVLFGMARTVGIAIQIVYERCEARGGKGLPLVRPDYIYKERKNS
jgi:citrate synthase